MAQVAAAVMTVFFSVQASASGGWPDCDTTCLVTSYVIETDTVECIDDLAAYNCAALTLVDTCTLAQTLAFHTIGGGADTVTTCVATTAMGVGPDGAVRLLGITASGLADSDMFMETGPGLTLTQYANDIAVLTGEIAAENNPDQRFEVFIVYENRVDGADWGGGFKYAMGCEPPTDTWDIYTVKAEQSYLKGRGAYEGSLLHIQHAPSSQYFGFQVGEGANDHNCDYGAGGWFSWNGTLCGTEVAGALGDVIVDLDCTSDFDPCTAQSTVFFSAFVADCGVLEYTMDVLRIDEEAPVISGLPNDTVVDCISEFPVPDGVTATDNCPVPGYPELTYEGVFEVEAQEGYCHTYEQRWIATDECGNVSVGIRVFNQVEDVPPAMVGDEIVVLECDEWPGGFEPSFSALVEAGIIDAVDNCEVDTVLIEYGVMSGGCHYDHIMTYTPIDGCGNVGDSFYQIVVVDDQTQPVLINVPADTVISCVSDPDAVDALPHAIDNCDPDVNVTLEVNLLDDGDGCDETYIIERIFTAQDCSYNHALDTQYVHVVDTAAPVIVLTAPADVALSGCFGDLDLSVAAQGTATYTASDDCGAMTEDLTYADGEVAYPCGEGGGSGSFDRTWTLTVTDCAGNVATLVEVQSISVADGEAPAISALPSVSLDCGLWADGFDADDASALGWVSAADNCALDNISLTPIAEFSNGCSSEWEVEYTATDACGNSSSATQIIALLDTVAPAFTLLPADANLACDGDPEPYIEGEAVADDLCSEVTISTHDELVIDGCASSAVWERTITATDECGNATEHIQRFFRVDDTAPSITDWPADTAVTCGLFPFDPATVSFADDCDTAPVLSVVDDTVSYDCPGTFTVHRRITVTDCTGNIGEEIQVIEVSDTVAPVLVTSGPSIEIPCSDWTCDIDFFMGLGHVSATDNCEEVDLSVQCNEFSGGCLGDEGVFTLLYTAVDPCGNTSTAEQVVTLTDDVAPVGSIVCPEDVEFNLDGDCTFDLGAPAADAPWGAATGSATDNCDEAPIWTLSYMDAEPVFACGDAGGMTIVRTHILVSEDQCGNVDSTTCTQNIVLLDATGPVITLDPPMPQNIFGCLADTDTSTSNLGMLTATAEDACGGAVSISIAYTDQVTVSCVGDDANPEGNSTLERTFTVTATDCGGNSSTASHTQNVNFFDVDAPSLTITCPSDTAVASEEDCSADLSTGLLGLPDVVATDNCDTDVDFTISHADVASPGACDGSEVITRTFTVTAVDDCGHVATASCEQVITVLDETPPTIALVCPDDAEIYLDADCSWSGSAGQPNVIVADACDPAASYGVSYADHDTLQLCSGDDSMTEGSLSFIRTWTVTAADDCGNTSEESCDQLITLLDTLAPTNHVLETLTTDTLFLDAACSADLMPSVTPSSSAEDGCDSEVALGVTYSDDPAVYAAQSDGVALEIDTVAVNGIPGTNTYRIYAVLNNPDDHLSAVVGEGFNATWITSTAPFHQHPLGGPTPEFIDPILFDAFPELEFDSWVTIGIDGPPAAASGQAGLQVVESSPWVAAFQTGGSISLNSFYGDGWFAVPTASNGVPGPDGRVLLAQLTTSGHVSGQMYVQVLEGGPGGVDSRYTLAFGNACTDEDGAQEGSYSFMRTWQSVATDDCGNADTAVTFQNIAVLDTTAPQLTETCGLMNGETIALPCAGSEILDFDPMPLPCDVEAVDNCDTEVGIARFDEVDADAPTGSACNVCAPSVPAPFNGDLTCDLGAPESMQLFNFAGQPSAGFTLESTEVSRVVVGCDSSLSITLHLTDGEGGGFLFEADYTGGWDWDAWSGEDHPNGVGGSYKKDCADVLPGEPIWLDWHYFVMLGGQLTGTGTYAGSSFTLSHQPANAFYGFQVGTGANNQNDQYGASGWFMWQGNVVVDGVDQGVMGSSGDIFMDLDCCLPWSATHQYVAQDDCGNATPFQYTVVNNGTLDEGGAGLSGSSQHGGPVIISDNGVSIKQPFRILGLSPNPTSDLAQLQFEVDVQQRLTIRLHAMTGEFLMELFDGTAEPGTAYQVEIGVAGLSSGLYQLRVAGATHSEVRKLLVAE